MEELLARERETGQHVNHLLKQHDVSIRSLLVAFDEYRTACELVVFADFTLAEKQEMRLWAAHTEGKRYFSHELRRMRKQGGDRPVEARALVELYLKFIKGSQRFYRDHIHRLSVAFGGIPELQAVAQQVKPDLAGESSQVMPTPELCKMALNSCHRSLICLGDLSRYRATDQLDKKPDFGPAVGYYGLACTICPSSGMGYHQQAVVALDQRHHLRAIYYLYRSIVVAQPHPLAAKNLKLEFDKTNAAWDKGELIQKGPPNDPEAPKRALVGWFVRLHSMCYRGEHFRGYDELEREVMSQLARELQQRPLDATLTRMILVNMAAQASSIENYKLSQSPQNEFSFYSFLRVNIRTFTVILELFHQDLHDVARDPEFVDVDLTAKLLPTTLRILPALRLYSSWLLLNIHLVLGLANEDILTDSIVTFWKTYARTLDLVAADFPIWDLEDSPEVTYMLEEDVEILGFEPLIDAETGKTSKLWLDQHTGLIKSRFSDVALARLSNEEEMVGRVQDFLKDGLFFANDIDAAPIRLQGTRILYGDEEPRALPAPPSLQKSGPVQAKQPEMVMSNPAKPLSYAAAAASSKPRLAKSTGPPTNTGKATTAQAHRVQDAQMSRMVDDLVDDDDGNNPVTPPQQLSASPAVVTTNGEITLSSLQDSAKELPTPVYAYGAEASKANHGYQPKAKVTGQAQSISSFWSTFPASVTTANSPKPPPGIPVTLTSTPQARGHSRVGSATSIGSRGSMNVADSWSSLDSAPRNAGQVSRMNVATPAGKTTKSVEQSNVPSPLLFGAGDSLWSANPRRSFSAVSPPNTYGG